MNRVLIRNGRVVDPKQKLNKVTDLYIEDGKIVAPREAFNVDTVIDAGGKIVAPGFIDIHMHEDVYDACEDTFETTMAESMLRMGVTLSLGGNCGVNNGLPSKYLDAVDRDGAATNLALLIGHTTLRKLADDAYDKYGHVSRQTLDKMVAECKIQLDSGCFGVSFGVKYVPGTTTSEILALAGLCRDGGMLVSSHVRGDVDKVFEGGRELAEIARAGVRVQLSHIGSMGGYGQMEELLNQIDGYRAEGLDYWCDCYPYNAFSTEIGNTTYDDGFLESYRADYSAVLMCSGKYAGQRCTKEIFEYERANEPEAVTIGFFMKEEDIERAYQRPYVMVGSDGFRDGEQGHPRAAGTFPKFFRDYVRSGKLSLEEGIAKMTTLAAERLCLEKKGNLMVGSDADIVIFDYDEMEDKATYDLPTLPPVGISCVLIGGQIAMKDGEIVNGRLGRSVRRKK